MLVCYPNDFQDDEPARNHCRDLIIESANLALQVRFLGEGVSVMELVPNPKCIYVQ